jgi:hypothetical protein
MRFKVILDSNQTGAVGNAILRFELQLIIGDHTCLEEFHFEQVCQNEADLATVSRCQQVPVRTRSKGIGILNLDS